MVERRLKRCLTELRRLTSKPSWGPSEIVDFMVASRVVMEDKGLQKTYAYLNLYCNWVVHPRLSETVVCLQVLERLTDVLVKYAGSDIEPEYKYGSFLKAFQQDVRASLGLRALKGEVLDFLSHFELPDGGLRSPAVWKDFCGSMLWKLVGRSIEFPGEGQSAKRKGLRRIRESIHFRTGGNPRLGVKRFCFAEGKVPRLNVVIFWEVETELGVRVVGPLTDMDFDEGR
jgi:hypothetical protein